MNLEAKQRPEAAEHLLYAMSSYSKKTTGIPSIVIWMHPGEDVVHGPRIKVSNIKGKARFRDEDCFSISISEDPEVKAGECLLSAKEERAVKKFVALNSKLLTKLWNEEITSDEFSAKAQKV